jgi:hypothetical protein
MGLEEIVRVPQKGRRSSFAQAREIAAAVAPVPSCNRCYAETGSGCLGIGGQSGKQRPSLLLGGQQGFARYFH